jgi:hypothetical protein
MQLLELLKWRHCKSLNCEKLLHLNSVVQPCSNGGTQSTYYRWENAGRTWRLESNRWNKPLDGSIQRSSTRKVSFEKSLRYFISAGKLRWLQAEHWCALCHYSTVLNQEACSLILQSHAEVYLGHCIPRILVCQDDLRGE